MIFEVPSALRSHIVSMCPNGIVVFCDVPQMYKADAEELQKEWAEECKKIAPETYSPVFNIKDGYWDKMFEALKQGPTCATAIVTENGVDYVHHDDTTAKNKTGMIF